MHVDLRISQKCSTVELLYLLFPDFNFYCKEDGMDFSQKELEKTNKPRHFHGRCDKQVVRFHVYIATGVTRLGSVAMQKMN